MSDSPPPAAPGPARADAPPVEPVDLHKPETPSPAPVVPAAAPDRPGDEGGQDPPRRKLRNWQLAALTLLAVGFLVGAFFLGQSGDDDDPPTAGPSGTNPPTSVAPAPAPDGFTTFRDNVTGASLSYPEGWETLELTPDSEQRLVATPGGENSISIRSTQVGFNVTPADLATAKEQTDKLLADQGLTEVLEQDALTVNGLSSVYYRYNFTDSATSQQGVHEHFFIFHSGYMTQLVFQALPTTEYAGLSTTFAQIATTFRAPDVAAPPLPSTTSTTAAAPPSSSP